MRQKAVHLLVDDALPPELRTGAPDVSAKGLATLMHQVAVSHPDRYKDTLKQIGDAGREAAYWQGESMGLDDLRPVIDTPAYLRQMDAEVAQATKGLKDPDVIRTTRENIWHKWSANIQKASMKAALAKGNAVGLSVASGARGKPLQLQAMLSTPGTFETYKGHIIPIFARRSYAEGVSPAEWLAGTYGARTSTVSTKVATALGGHFSKMLGQVSAPMMVTTADCGTNNGIELAKNDASMRNRFLATDTAGVKGGALLDRKTLGHLVNNHKGDTLIVRSPLTCQAPEGLCAKCLGADPRGHLYPVGYGAGFTAANAIGEPLCLHGSTLVRMADGSTKLITDIQPGDMVLGSDMEGKLTPTKVLRWFENGRRVCVRTVARIGTSQEVELISTTAHKILSHKGPKGSVVRPKIQPVESTDTRERHTLLVANHERPCDPAAHAEVIEQLFFSYDLTYDIEVDNDTHLFALANGLVISNTQLALNQKHTSGAATKKKSYSGLSWLQRFVQIPDNFPDRAPVAEQAGSVSVQPAPQGGNYVYVGDKTHYVPQHLNLLVKTGQQVEAGQPLSEGIIRPDDVVRLRGLGEGRNYYATRLHQMLDDSGAANDRRNVEVVARAAVNHVRITDADGWKGHLPDDMVPYNHVLKDFEPAEDSEEKAPHEAVGQYLQKAALHYTPGTQLTSSMADQLHKAGYKSLLVSKTDPGFEPEMVRLQTQSFATPDWLAALGTSYLSKQLATRAQRGQDTNIRSNIHFAPRLAIGEGFGADAARTGKF
jgi:DNA-directed RNA polymerase subunit beta'